MIVKLYESSLFFVSKCWFIYLHCLSFITKFYYYLPIKALPRDKLEFKMRGRTIIMMRNLTYKKFQKGITVEKWCTVDVSHFRLPIIGIPISNSFIGEKKFSKNWVKKVIRHWTCSRRRWRPSCGSRRRRNKFYTLKSRSKSGFTKLQSTFKIWPAFIGVRFIFWSISNSN